MVKIGVTGGIGSGKTTVCRFFQLLGIPVFYSDEAAKALMNRDETLIGQIQEAFGTDVYLDGVLQRSVLASRVFHSEAKLQLLNSLVHPAVFRAFDRWVDKKSAPYVIKEAAILFESGSYADCQATVLVKAPENLRVRRIISRDGSPEQAIRDRMSRQMPEEEKERRATFLVYNDGSTLLIPQLLALHQQFLQL
jgi:dephospho-CoA kinase